MAVQAQVNDEKSKVSSPDTKEQVKPTNQEAAKPEQNTQKPPEETPEQINWRKFRQERERERKEKEETEKTLRKSQEEAAALKAAVESLVSKPSRPSQDNDFQDVSESEEQKIAKQVKKVLDEERRKDADERSQREKAELPNKLANTFSDFNTVCTQENLDYLEYHYPEVAHAFKNSPDSFDKWANIYKAVKRFVATPDSKRDQAKIEKNLAKPQSMSVAGMTQTGDESPKELTDKRRADNWARMQRIMKGGR